MISRARRNFSGKNFEISGFLCLWGNKVGEIESVYKKIPGKAFLLIPVFLFASQMLVLLNQCRLEQLTYSMFCFFWGGGQTELFEVLFLQEKLELAALGHKAETSVKLFGALVELPDIELDPLTVKFAGKVGKVFQKRGTEALSPALAFDTEVVYVEHEGTVHMRSFFGAAQPAKGVSPEFTVFADREGRRIGIGKEL